MKTYRYRRILPVFLLLIAILVPSERVFAAGLNRTSARIAVGSRLQLTVSSAKPSALRWKSSKPAVATVTGKGLVSGKKAGKAVITVTAGSRKYTCSVTVVKKQSTAARKPTTKVDSNTVGMTSREAKIYKAMYAKKSVYREGMSWKSDRFYAWRGGIFRGGYGCVAFAFRLSDAAFGSAPAKIHYNLRNVRIGDIVRFGKNAHSVVVMKIVGNTAVFAEGCYGDKVHWGRTMTLAKLRSEGSYVLTRYA